VAELAWGAATHAGRLRADNEDNVLARDGVFVVADGMGGHEAGEVASALAIERIEAALDDDGLPSANDVVEAINGANGDIFRAAIANPAQRGMGTTVTAIAVIADPLAGRGEPNLDVNDPAATPIVPKEPDEALVLANVGDSRTYLFRHDRLRRVTVDHSYVQELVATGHITEDEARRHPRRNIVTRALGIDPDVKVDWWTLPLIRGDRFLLCSDGLVDEVDDDAISATLSTVTDPQEAADRLVEQANDAGGRDNVTVVVVDVLEGDDPPHPTEELDVVPTWADDDEGPTPAGTLEIDADPNGTSAIRADAARRPKRRRRVLRVLAGIAIVAVLVIGFATFSAWARSGYFVAFDDNCEAIIYRGRSGGVLWFDPTAETEGGPTCDQLTDEAIAAIDDEPRFDTRDEAAEFLVSSVTTTTTTTTTTTVRPRTTTSPSTAAAVTDTAGP
jgi:serine/threonine protein phosphatase PrpC